MLPFTKRNARFEDDVDSVDLGTSEIEVVQASPNRHRFAAPTPSTSTANRRGDSGVRPFPRRPSPPAPPTSSFPSDDFDADLETEEATRVFEDARLYDTPTRIAPEQSAAYARTMDHAAADPSNWSRAVDAPFGIADDDVDSERTIARPAAITSAPPPMFRDGREVRATSDVRELARTPAPRAPGSAAMVARPSIVRPPPTPPRMAPPPARVPMFDAIPLEEQEHTAMMQVPAAMRARAVTMEMPAAQFAKPAAAPLDAETRARVIAQLTGRIVPPADPEHVAIDQAIAAQLASVPRARMVMPQGAPHAFPSSLAHDSSSHALATDAVIVVDGPVTARAERKKGNLAKWSASLVALGVLAGLGVSAIVKQNEVARNQAVHATTVPAAFGKARTMDMGPALGTNDGTALPPVSEQVQPQATAPQNQVIPTTMPIPPALAMQTGSIGPNDHIQMNAFVTSGPATNGATAVPGLAQNDAPPVPATKHPVATRRLAPRAPTPTETDATTATPVATPKPSGRQPRQIGPSEADLAAAKAALANATNDSNSL